MRNASANDSDYLEARPTTRQISACATYVAACSAKARSSHAGRACRAIRTESSASEKRNAMTMTPASSATPSARRTQRRADVFGAGMLLRFRSALPQRKEVREQPICAGHAVRELPVEGVREIRVVALAVVRRQPSSPLWGLSLIVRLQHRCVRVVALAEELRPALLDPSVEVRPGDDVGGRELRTRGGQD